MIIRDFQPEQCLKESMQMRGFQQIVPARDERDVLRRIIHDDGEMVACRRLLP